jgi:PST family polysaccharide transporter
MVAVACVSQLDRLIIGRFFGASLLGMYRQAQQLMLAPIEQLRAPLSSVATPSLSILQTDSGRYRRYYQRIALAMALATMPLGLFVAIYAEEITHVLLGPKWIAATVFLRIFGLVMFLKPSLETTGLVMMTYGLSKRLLVLTVAYHAMFAVFMFVGIRWGAEGVALSNVVTAVLLMFPTLYFALRGTPVTVGAFFSAMSTPAIASTAMAGALLLFRNSVSRYGMTVSLFSGLALGAAIYATVVFSLPRGRREVVALISAALGSLKPHQPGIVAIDETEKLGIR